MNTVDCFVKRVTGKPYRKYGKWWVPVDYVSWGAPGHTELMFDTEAEALAVNEDTVFQA